MAGRRAKPQRTLDPAKTQSLLNKLHVCREEAVIAEVRIDLPLAAGLVMLVRSPDALACILSGHPGALGGPSVGIHRPRPDLTNDFPRNRQLLIDAMGACRDEPSGNVDFHSPLSSAFNMMRRAIDAVALLLTGDRELFWAKGSSLIDTTQAMAEARAARARELAARTADRG